MNKLTRKDLLALPVRPWDTPSSYDSIIVLPTGTRHDSGYSHIMIVGCNNRKPVEIATQWSDDITWLHNGLKLRSDALLKCRALHFWANQPNVKFKVSHALSSIDVIMTKVDVA